MLIIIFGIIFAILAIFIIDKTILVDWKMNKMEKIEKEVIKKIFYSSFNII